MGNTFVKSQIKTMKRGIGTAIFLLYCASIPAAPLSWTLEIDRVTVGSAILENISASNAWAEATQAGVVLEIPFIELPQSELSAGPLLMACPGSTFHVIEHLCQDGNWSIPVTNQWPLLQGRLLSTVISEDLLQIETNGTLGTMHWKSTLLSEGDETSIRVEIPEQSLDVLNFIGQEIEVYSWISAGRFHGNAVVSNSVAQGQRLSTQLVFTDVEFDSPDGLYAGLEVSTALSIQVEPQNDKSLSLNAELLGGELLLMDFYRDFSDQSLKLEAAGAWSEARVELSRISVTDDEALNLVGQATIPTDSERIVPDIIIREFQLEFPLAYQRYIESTASVFGLDGLRTEGSISWKGDWSPGSARSGEFRIKRFSLIDEDKGRFTIRGVDGQLMTSDVSRLTWDALSFEKMDLGAGQARLVLSTEEISLTEPLTIDVLGGQLDLEKFSFFFPSDGDPDIQLKASVSGVEMLQMSRAMGWPEFGGTLSGSIPAVSWKAGVIEIGGALDFQVFGGELVLTDLRVERPFGVLPSLAANLTATNLDLEQLTQTFEFGRIGGRADGYVHNLRMLNWQPVQFDAWFGTPKNDDERHGISRKAVQHLTAIGGGSATAMLSGPILKLFNNFSYRRLGLGCTLRNNVCQIRGIEEKGESVLIMEGAGIPKISIQAFNRAVDWPQLLAELKAVSRGEGIRVGN